MTLFKVLVAEQPRTFVQEAEEAGPRTFVQEAEEAAVEEAKPAQAPLLRKCDITCDVLYHNCL